MPLFEYVCASCGNAFEALVRGKDEVVSCPSCGSVDLKKAFSVFASPGGHADTGAPPAGT